MVLNAMHVTLAHSAPRAPAEACSPTSPRRVPTELPAYGAPAAVTTLAHHWSRSRCLRSGLSFELGISAYYHDASLRATVLLR
jgi:hypothetical protein